MTANIVQLVQERIKGFIVSDTEVVYIPMIPINKIEEVLKELGFNTDDPVLSETNGWQVDFWYKYTNSIDTIIQISGSLHYGNFALTKEKI